MKKILIAIFVLGCAIAFSNCSKHNDLPLVNLDSDTLIDKHFNFNTGSYWIYKDSLSGRIDCFFVANNYYVKLGEQNKVYNYHFVALADRNADGTNVKDSSAWVFNFQDSKLVLDLYYGRNAYGWKNDITLDPLVMYPFGTGSLDNTFDTATVNYVDSFYMQDTLKLYNVAVVHHHISVLQSQLAPGLTTINDWFYVNDSVGLIKMSINHPQDTLRHVWELQRYHIVKK